MASFSEQLWNIAEPNYNQIQSDLKDLIAKLENSTTNIVTLDPTSTANLQISVQFMQSESQSVYFLEKSGF